MSDAIGWAVRQCRGGETREARAAVARETPLTIRLNGKELVTLLTDGSCPEELALGFLRNEGLLDRAAQMRSLWCDAKTGEVLVEAEVDERLVRAVYGKRMVASGCGKGSVFYHVLDSVKAGRVRAPDGLRLPLTFLYAQGAQLAVRSAAYKSTRGVHGAALLDDAGVICFREDIGRHNALDKLGGWLLRDGRDAGRLALYTTGRITSEAALKAGRIGAPIVLSRSMPTELALQLATQMELTVVGGLRGRACTIFTRADRIVAD